MLPPTTPIARSCIHWRLEKARKALNSLSKNKAARKARATREFFKTVNTNGSDSATANLLRKMENPLTTPVKAANQTPLFSSTQGFTVEEVKKQGGKRKILVFGNPWVERDALPLKLLPRLRKAFPEIEFKEMVPEEDLQAEGRKLFILDVVQGLRKAEVIEDLARLQTVKRVSLHFFDLAHNLQLLKATDLIDSAKIFGVPMGLEEATAFRQVSALIKASLP